MKTPSDPQGSTCSLPLLARLLLLLLLVAGLCPIHATPVAGPRPHRQRAVDDTAWTALVNTLLSGAELVQESLGSLAADATATTTYDYIIVGGGTAGATLAARLASALPNRSIALVEAGVLYTVAKPVLSSIPIGGIVGIGASPLDSNPLIDWEFVTEPQAGAAGRQLHYARGKCIGGSSAINLMLHHRGSRGSYDAWADAVGDDSYRLDAWLPYFQRSVTFAPPDASKRRANATTLSDDAAAADGPVQVGYANWVPVWATWLEKGLQSLGLNRTRAFNSGGLLGFHYAQTTLRASDQTRSTSAEYIRAARDAGRANLKVHQATMARRIVLDDDGDGLRATGVVVGGGSSAAGGEHTLRAAREVVVAAGAFHSPQLLMVSGIGPRGALEAAGVAVAVERPGVGQNMWDHVMFGPTYRVAFDTLDRVLHDPLVLAAALADYAVERAGPATSNAADLLGWEKLSALADGDGGVQLSAATRAALAGFADDWPEVEHIAANGFMGDFAFPALQQPLDGHQYATILGAMVAPLSRGNVTLRSASVDDLPRVSPNWLTHAADQELAVAWFRRMRAVWRALAAMPDADVVVGDEYWPGAAVESDADVLATIRESLMTVWHAAGTCKMGRADDAMAVVDSRARVFGVEGLRVVDASAFPLLPPGHPQSTVYALAEKIAADIVQGEGEGEGE